MNINEGGFASKSTSNSKKEVEETELQTSASGSHGEGSDSGDINTKIDMNDAEEESEDIVGEEVDDWINDGENLEEFNGKKTVDENMQRSFVQSDINGDGMLDAYEIRSLFGNGAQIRRDINHFFIQADTDCNGCISYSEYHTFAVLHNL